jgi:hypothetical protein
MKTENTNDDGAHAYYDRLKLAYGKVPNFYTSRYYSPAKDNIKGVHICFPALDKKSAISESQIRLAYGTGWDPEEFEILEVNECLPKDMPIELIEWLKKQ